MWLQREIRLQARSRGFHLITEQVLRALPELCEYRIGLLHFDRDEAVCGKRYDPKVLLVAPMSGHYATLLRGTVEAMIQEHNLYVTDWRDARDIPLMVGSIDTRRNPTVVKELARKRDIGWFERNVIAHVPWPNAGWLRKVYPGFIQLTGFMTMNLDRHLDAHKDLFNNLVQGDCDSVDQHRKFYVMISSAALCPGFLD